MALETYRYRARSSDGASVRGSLQARDAASVVDFLRARSLFVTAIAGERGAAGPLRRAARQNATPRGDVLTCFRSLSTLLRAGVALRHALSITIGRTRGAELAEAWRSILANVEAGLSLADAMSLHPGQFPSLHLALIRAGETGGILADVLERLALLVERETAQTRRLRAALAAPAIAAGTASLLVVCLIGEHVATFAQPGAGFHVDLLAALLPLLLIGATALGMQRFARTSAGGVALDALRFGLPIVGPLLHTAIRARVTRLLATFVCSGVELSAAFDAIVPVAESAWYARAFEHAGRALRDDKPLVQALREAPFLDPLMVALLRLGEERGSIDEMLLTLADFFEHEIDAAFATLGAILEPALIVVLSGLVGFLVRSIFLPLYR